MNPSLIFLGVFVLQFSQGIQLPPDTFTEASVLKDGSSSRGNGGVCSGDPFLSSDPYEGKVFLFPWKESERRGDWYENYGYCNKYCAEMVTINSDAENNYFHWFMRSTVGMPNPGAWLGAQVINATGPTRWMTRERVLYSNPAPGEYNEPGVTCLHVGWSAENKWWNYYCSTKSMMIVCQRKNVRYAKSNNPILTSEA